MVELGHRCPGPGRTQLAARVDSMLPHGRVTTLLSSPGGDEALR